jgi:hypothetical protein
MSEYENKAKIVESLVNKLRQAYQDALLSTAEEHQELMKDYPQIPLEFSSEDHKKVASMMPAIIRLLHFVAAGPVRIADTTSTNNRPTRDLKWAATGVKKAAKALTMPKTPESEARLEVCKGCDQWTGKSCKVCGCFVNLKVRIPEEKCPLGKW